MVKLMKGSSRECTIFPMYCLSMTTNNSYLHPSFRPHYLENVLYGRRLMTEFLIDLMMKNEATTLRSTSCQAVLKEEIDAIVKAFIKKESNGSVSAIDMRNISKMVSFLFDCMNKLNDEKMGTMKWLSPVLSKCIQTNDGTIRASVQILLQRLLDGSAPASIGKAETTPATEDEA